MQKSHIQYELHKFAQYLTEAYTYQMLITNNQGQAKGCVFLDVNPAFEKTAGVKSESIIGKKATEVFSQLKTSNFDWISFLGKATLSRKRMILPNMLIFSTVGARLLSTRLMICTLL